MVGRAAHSETFPGHGILRLSRFSRAGFGKTNFRSEQKGLVLLSPSNTEYGATEPALFPNLVLISRDRAHRYRSVQKGVWSQVSRTLNETLEDLVSGPRSLARMLETSRKYRQCFQKAQEPYLRGKDGLEPDDGTGFSRVIQNLAFAEQRFDSRARPLFRLFQLLPAAIDALAALTGSEGDIGDRNWATAQPPALTP